MRGHTSMVGHPVAGTSPTAHLDAFQSRVDARRMTRRYRRPWRLDIDRQAGVPRVLGLDAIVQQVARTLDAAGAPGPAGVGLILSDDEEMARLNARHMGHAGPTDVLSFPLLPPSAFPRHEGKRDEVRQGEAIPFALPPGRRIDLGEIVVSVERAIAQAEDGRGGHQGDVRWAPADELRLLLTHGTLHLCGWDHADPVEEAAMRHLERELMAAG